MPPEAYKDRWQTIGHGRPWTGMIKNRRKNGDHCWVQAAETLYTQMRAARESGQNHPAFVLRSGEVRHTGLRGLSGRLRRITITARLGMGLVAMVLLGMVPQLLEMLGLHLHGSQQVGCNSPVWCLGLCCC